MVGAVILQSFTAAQGASGVWTPDSGQGTAYNLAGTGSVAGSTTTAVTTGTSSSSSGSSVTTSGNGNSIANMTIASQTGATSAISTIDSAISYVQAERSNLGAVQNRLTYTVDNLTNAMTNAASARSSVWILITQKRQPNWRERKSFSRLLQQCWLKQISNRRLFWHSCNSSYF